MSDIYLTEIRRLYKSGRLLPFVGAGVSRSVSWLVEGKNKHGPSWSELADEAARQIGFDQPELLRMRGTELQILEYYGRRNGGFTPLTNWLYKEMSPPDASLLASPIHKSLSGLDKCDLIYTTNYDNYLERGLRLHGRDPFRIANENDIVNWQRSDRRSACQIIKFHGDWDAPDTMVVSEADYERRLRLGALMDDRFLADTLGRALLFVGYSFRDWNVSYLFRLVNDLRGSFPRSISGLRAYIIIPDPSDFEMELFAARRIGVVGYSSLKREDGIANILEQIGS